jgi:hypothetical protein
VSTSEDDPLGLSAVIPGQLAWLTSRKMTAMESSAYLAERSEYQRHPIGPTVARRLRGLARQEARAQQQRIVTPDWSPQGAIPGLIVAQRYVGGDAFGASRQTFELDMAIRRAAALIEVLNAGEQVTSWPRPIRPERGGLWLLDATYGSLELLWTFYNSLVGVATSTPISLASFASLAWSSSRSASRMARSWVVRRLEPGEVAQRPSASTPTEAVGETWQERTTKGMIPVFQAAISQGTGFDFRATGPSGEVRFIIAPRGDSQADI